MPLPQDSVPSTRPRAPSGLLAALPPAIQAALVPVKPLYLVDFAVYKPPEELLVRLEDVEQAWIKQVKSGGGSVFMGEGSAADDEEALSVIEFQGKVYLKSGLGHQATYLPKAIHPKYCGNNPRTDLDSAMVEAKQAICGAVQALLDKTGLRPRDIDVLVTTCSIYCPTPSMASMVCNAFGMRSDIVSYHLGGMGCANGVVGVNLVADLLTAHPGCRALFVTNETTTPAFYRGTDKHRLVTNVLFRMGAAAMLMSNRPSDASWAKYKCWARERVHLAAREESYRCIWYGPDERGLPGIYLGMNVVTEASRGLTQAMTKVAPYILTWSELGRFVRHSLKYGFSTARRATGAGAKAAANVAASAADAAGSALEGKGGQQGATASVGSAAEGSQKGAAQQQQAQQGGRGSSEISPAAAEPAGPDASAAGTPAPATGADEAPGGGTVQRKLTAAERLHKVAEDLRAAAPYTDKPAPPSKRPWVPPPAEHEFVPKFSECVQHFCIHAGGAKVLDGIGAALRLDEYHLAPSRAVMHDYGNVSSSTTWYTLAYTESTRGVLQGDRVLQVGVGSGIKCGVNVWQALRDVTDPHPAWQHRNVKGELPATHARQFPRARRNMMNDPLTGLAWVALAALMVLLAMVVARWQPGGLGGLLLGRGRAQS